MSVHKNVFPLVCVCGPTGIGKSSFGISLARAISGEVINADSVQVYKGFDIGSGKVRADEMGGVRHHLLSHVNPSEHYSAGRFRKEAMHAISDIYGRGAIPILVGGTGLYVRALLSSFMGSMDDLYGQAFDLSRDLLHRFMRTLDKDEYTKCLTQYLKLVDTEALDRNGEADIARNERALMLSLAFGLPAKMYRKIFNQDPFPLASLVILMEEDRNVLYKKINERVELMFESGWLDEVASLRSLCPQSSALQSIGYRHICAELNSKDSKLLDKLSLINNIQRDTRRFAKRQITWWKNQPSALGWCMADVSHAGGSDVITGSRDELLGVLSACIKDFFVTSLHVSDAQSEIDRSCSSTVTYVRIKII